ncbi:uncharacterized protein LOC110039754 [Orbicella faveolata]|uniref:uncharacterized protein LOC110039754 n=1 Tax=Orbicella faveolata TaxID=48498 RepID=UPI0009E45662|nr:uncharacterized protein LOC110039754 [Orbicella faveolata]
MWIKSLIICLVSVSSIEARGIRVRRNLGDVCENMWKASGNNMIMGTDLTVDTSNTAKKLFTLTSTGEGKLKNAVYTKFKALLDNYVPDELKPEVGDPKEATEEDDFINTIAVEGGPMDIAFKYLQAAGKTTTAVRYYRTILISH